MKPNHFLFLTFCAILFLYSCENSKGKVSYNIKFTTQSIVLSKSNSYKIANTDTREHYTQFGNYITSLTPTKFTAKLWTLGYIDKVMKQNSNEANMLQYIEQNSYKLGFDDPSRIVDFSNNSIVNFNPVLYGRVNTTNQFEDKTINFIYFYFIPINLYQEIQLPIEYYNIQLSMFSNNAISNNVLKVNHNEMLQKIFPTANISNNIYFIFGNTDSTFIVNKNGEKVELSSNCPIATPGNSLVVRSNKYTNMNFTSPSIDENKVMSGIVVLTQIILFKYILDLIIFHIQRMTYLFMHLNFGSVYTLN
jgi:hypothetical protein